MLLARALYRQPKILFLDEGTAHLDVDNERQINRNLVNLNMTRISVAHRSEFAGGAGRILHVCRTVSELAVPVVPRAVQAFRQISDDRGGVQPGALSATMPPAKPLKHNAHLRDLGEKTESAKEALDKLMLQTAQREQHHNQIGASVEALKKG